MGDEINSLNLSEKVKKANKTFYNIIADSYEKIDGKRDKTTTEWISSKLRDLSSSLQTKKKIVLDIGCGSGFIMRNALPFFDYIIGVDISHKILIPLKNQGYAVVCADIDYLPFKKESFDMITCFAVLHHIFIYETFFSECFRVLKNNGIFYSDHDLDSIFRKRFSFFINIYRFFFNEERKYNSKEKKVTHELYKFTEIHHNGIPTRLIKVIMQNNGFKDIHISYHWKGLFSCLTKFLEKYHFMSSCGNAPLVAFEAKK